MEEDAARRTTRRRRWNRGGKICRPGQKTGGSVEGSPPPPRPRDRDACGNGGGAPLSSLLPPRPELDSRAAAAYDDDDEAVRRPLRPDEGQKRVLDHDVVEGREQEADVSRLLPPPHPPSHSPPVCRRQAGGEEEGLDDVLATAAAAATSKCGTMNTLNLLAGEIDRRWAMLADEDEGGGVVASAGGRRFLGGRRAVEYVVLPRPSATGGVGRSASRAERHADACWRVAFRGLGYGDGGGGGDDASSSPADAASGWGAARRVGGATGAEAPTGDVDRPGGGHQAVTY